MAKHEVKFESQSRRIDNILKVLNGYGIASIEEAEAICDLVPIKLVERIEINSPFFYQYAEHPAFRVACRNV